MQADTIKSMSLLRRLKFMTKNVRNTTGKREKRLLSRLWLDFTMPHDLMSFKPKPAEYISFHV